MVVGGVVVVTVGLVALLAAPLLADVELTELLPLAPHAHIDKLSAPMRQYL